MKSHHTLFLSIFLVALTGCSESNNDDPTTPQPTNNRSFQMGFTTWPYDATEAAVEDTYDRIDDHGDVIAHHIDGGVPWEEALTGVPYHINVENELQARMNSTPAGKSVYLGITPLSSGRDSMGGNWGEDFNEPRTGEWANRDFSSPEARIAYTNWVADLIDRFDPDYVNYAIEVSVNLEYNEAGWSDLVGFCSVVYDSIKVMHPDLPLFVSVALKNPISTDASVIRDHFSELLPYTDYVGVSAYPYAFFELNDAGNPENLSDDWLSQAQDLAQGKPLVIAETGWIAEDLNIPDFGLQVSSTPQWQADYVESLLDEADRLNVQLVIWFAIVDYDLMWEGILQEDPLSAIWRDSGLYDSELVARPALDIWDGWLETEYSR